VTVVGSLNVDLVATMERLPRPGETVAALEVARRPGGKGANQALGAAAAGAAVEMVGRLGDDPDGAAYRQALNDRSVGVGHVALTAETSSGLALVMVDARGENSIVVVPGANHHVGVDDVDRAAAVIERADVLALQLELTLEVVSRAAATAQRSATRVLLNPSPLVPLPPALLGAADPLVVNQHEATELLKLAGMSDGSSARTGAHEPEAAAAAARRLLSLGPRSVCVTLGAEGAVWVDDRGAVALPASSTRVVDTTGAGDAFAGALAAALANGLAPREALTRAVAAGGEAVGHAGAQSWTL